MYEWERARKGGFVMTYLRGFVGFTLVLAVLVFFVSEVMGADDIMVLRYTDGSIQRIRLEKPSESIRQIEFLEGGRISGPDPWRDNRIKVISATYGMNYGASFGNVTNHLAEICDGKVECEYVIDYKVIGDPFPNRRKDYSVEWQCGRDPERHVMSVPPGAGMGEVIVLRCPVR